ncbi:MAG: glycosyltransferase [Nostoc sp. S4]|nr:glycosyltransferase [Nostoc sp. S4]
MNTNGSTKDYYSDINLTEKSLDENHSLKKMLRFIGYNKNVVDFGCATGYFAQLLNNRGCIVTGVEINSDAAKVAQQHCNKVIVADLDFVSITEILPNQYFDIAIFGDVLEHLRNPWKVLEETKHILKKNGYVVASIPNIAHGAIRLSLLQGKFEYTELGILDNTHLRFFTRKTIEDLFESSGYILNEIDFTKLPIFSGNNLIPKITKEEFNNDIIEQIEQDQDAEILQFIVKAIPYSLEAKYTALEAKYSVLTERSHKQLEQSQQLQSQIVAIKSNFERSQSQLQDTQAQLEQSQFQLQDTQAQLQDTQAQLERSQFQLQQTQIELERSQFQLQDTQAQLKLSQLELQQTQIELERSQGTIIAMNTSKFWQLRKIWFKFRHFVGLLDENPFHKSLWFKFTRKTNLLDNHSSFDASFFSKLKNFWSVFKTKGLRYSLNKLREKTSSKLKFEDSLLSTIALPDIPQTNDVNYQKWLNQNYPNRAALEKMIKTAKLLAYKPTISLIMPVFNTPARFLQEAIESVLNQVYPYWELCIADDYSTDNYIREILKDYSSKDSRIKVVFRTENGHISRCSNSAIEIATGEFIALLDHDDLLTPDALYEIALLLNKHPEADMIYSDEDKIDENCKLRDPFFKPDWCPDSFLSRMYTCHLGTYRRELVNAIGGFRIGYEGSQDYDLVLRLTEKTKKIFHIPKILYHWRIHPQSAASKPDQKPYAVKAAEKALVDALARRGEHGQVTQTPNLVGHYIIRYTINDYKLVSIIIPTRDLGNVLDKCLTSIFEKTTYPNYEVILIDNGSQEENTANIISKWQQKESSRFRCYQLDIPFNYSKINNYAVNQAKGDYLLFLNNDIEVITTDWINAMVEQAQRPSIGAVGALLLYPDNTVQHAGVLMGIGGVANHSHKHYSVNSPGYFGQILTVNNYLVVTAACLMCRREVFKAVSGFEEQLEVAFNDVDLCLKIVEQGYKNIYLPHVMLYHYESKSRGSDDTPTKLARFLKEIEYMEKKWKNFIEYDPCYSIHLTRNYEDYRIRV